MSKKPIDTVLKLRPRDVSSAIRLARSGGVAVFLWGPPGVAKSATSQQMATGNGEAFVDVRLSQMEPTDLRGIPYPVTEWNTTGVKWSSPFILPRDIDVSAVFNLPYNNPEVYDFSSLNPRGSNDIHYCTKIDITVSAIEENVIAEIINQSLSNVTVALYKMVDGQKTNEMVSGHVRISLKGKAKAIIALEEFNSAPPSVQAASYQLVLDRRLGEYIVPEGCYLMAMGNRETDKGVTFKMATPVMNRFDHIEIDTDSSVFYDDWFNWAVEKRINPEVLGYITAFKGDLFDFDPSTAQRGFPTPRSWEIISKILNGPDVKNANDNVIYGLIAGGVGQGIGVKFMEFRKLAADLPSADSILSGRLKKMPVLDGERKLSLSYALTTTLCYEMRDEIESVRRKYSVDSEFKASKEYAEWLKRADNFFEFVMENFQTEICIMGARMAISNYRLPFNVSKMQVFGKFTTKYRDYILA